MSAVTCLTWIPRGVAKSSPIKAEFNLQHITEFIRSWKKPSEPGSNHAFKSETKDLEEACDMSKYNLDTYDEEDSELNVDIDSIFCKNNCNDDENDPYIQNDEEDEFDQYEKSCFEIKSNDNLLVVGRAEDENGVIEIYVYNEDDDDFYVHHDIYLHSIPLCVEWVSCSSCDDGPSNFVITGCINSDISVWNLDVVDAVFPDFNLGKDRKTLKKKCKRNSVSSNGHSDAVLDISWNRFLKSVLASGSADSSICVWDLDRQELLSKIDCHHANIQSLQWHPNEPQYLLSSSVDGVIYVVDCRTPEEPCMSWKVHGEIEKILYNQSNPFNFICSTDLGFVHVGDCREKNILHSFQAHENAVTGLSMIFKIPNNLITASTDEHVKLWDISGKPTLISSQKLEVGSIFAAKACPDSSYIAAFGGNNSSNNLSVKNLLKEKCTD